MSCRSGHSGRSGHPSHRCDRASRRTLIALWESQRGVALKVLATWVAVNDSTLPDLFYACGELGQGSNFREFCGCE